ncbi:MAG TPA: MarR family transcriptional regulator [Phaeodactylibacter sp.]|nr:MarR family transcriptional regulator [Phaeodactylibacter sp.]
MKDTTVYPNIHRFTPSDCISGKVMKCNRIVANLFRKHLKPFNITDSQLSIIFVISKAKNSNQKKISELLYLEKSTVNRNLNRLLQKGVIAYTGKKELTLTKQGKQLLNAVIPHWEKAMTEIRILLNEDGENALNLLTKKLTR